MMESSFDPSSPQTTSHEDRLRLLVESVVEYAIFTLDPEGRVNSWNPGAERLTGYDANEIIGRHFSAFYTEEDVAGGKPEQHLATAVAQGHSEEESWNVRKNGSRFWASALMTALRGSDGELRGFGMMTRDLSDRIRGDDDLRESVERFQLLVESVSDYAIFMLDLDGRVVSWNTGAERLKGYRADEILGHDFSRFYTDEDVRAGKPQLLLETAINEGRAPAEGWRVRKDGSLFWASVVMTALRGPDGDLRGFGKITRDITEKKRAEDALRDALEREREATARLRELDQMRSEFVAIVAHDLRSPMTIATGFAEALLSGWERIPDEEKKDLLRRISNTTTSLSELVEDALQVSRIEAGQLGYQITSVDVRAIATRAAADLTPEGSARRIRIDASPDLPRASADERRLWQIFANLLSNALKFSPTAEPVEVELRARDGGVLVSIIDHGEGIAPEHHDLVFDRFSRVSQETRVGPRGTGLGLYICRSLVEAQGGRIWVESDRGQGATFRFTLPGAPDEAGAG